MDTLLQNGDVLSDCAGDLQAVHGVQEIIQRAMIRLRMKRGSFVYDPKLGSDLHRLDLHRLDQFTLLSVVQEALEGMEELTVTDVEKTVDWKEQVLYLTVYLNVSGQDAVLEVRDELWNQ